MPVSVSSLCVFELVILELSPNWQLALDPLHREIPSKFVIGLTRTDLAMQLSEVYIIVAMLQNV